MKHAKAARELAQRYLITKPGKFRLKDIDPADTWKLKSGDDAKELLAEGVKQLCDLQKKLYAQDKWAVLLIFQAMDAAGKDGTIDHVMSGINPQGCHNKWFTRLAVAAAIHDGMSSLGLAYPKVDAAKKKDLAAARAALLKQND